MHRLAVTLQSFARLEIRALACLEAVGRGGGSLFVVSFYSIKIDHGAAVRAEFL